MARDLDQLSTKSVLHDYRFAAHTPVIGRLVARLRSIWYNVAARWGDQSIIDQQSAYNQAVIRYMVVLEQPAGQGR
jgi:hypothetical protein